MCQELHNIKCHKAIENDFCWEYNLLHFITLYLLNFNIITKEPIEQIILYCNQCCHSGNGNCFCLVTIVIRRNKENIQW